MPCGDGDAFFDFGDRCFPMTTDSTIAEIDHADFSQAQIGPIEEDGTPIQCDQISSDNATGLVVDGQVPLIFNPPSSDDVILTLHVPCGPLPTAPPTLTPMTPEPTLTPTPAPLCPLTRGRYTLKTTGGAQRVATFGSFPFPAGAKIIQDVEAGDTNCVHHTVVPFPGGLTVPVFCVPALGFTSQVTQTGCGIGEIDSDGGSDFTVTEHGDTSDSTICNNLQKPCPSPGPAPDSSGRVDIAVGDGVADACAGGGTANAIVTVPVETLTWQAADSSCPDSDSTFNPGIDLLALQFPQTLDLTTDTNTAQFADIDGDGCAQSGLGPTGPFSSTGQCIDLVGHTVNVAASGTVFSSAAPTYDLLFTTVLDATFSGPAAFGGAACASPPPINFTGMATRCFVAP